MVNLVNQIFFVLFSTPNKSDAAGYFKQFPVALENVINDLKFKGSLPIW